VSTIAGIPSLGTIRSLALPFGRHSRSVEVGEPLAPGERVFVWDVRAKLLLYSLIITLPVIIFTTNVIQQSFSSTRDQILRGEMVRADRVSLQLDGALGTGEKSLTALAATSQIQGLQADEATTLFRNALDLDSNLGGLAAVDASGVRFANAGDALPESNAFHAFLQRVMLSRDRAVFAQVDPGASRQAAIIAVPFRSLDGQPSGALFAVLRLDSLAQEIAEPGDGDEDRMLVVVDRAGARVMSLERGIPIDRFVQDLQPLQTALGGHAFQGEYSDPHNNKSWLGAALPPSHYGWAVLTARPALAIYPAGLTNSLRGFVVLLLVLLLVLVLSATLARTAVRPLQRLTLAARSIGRRDFTQVVELHTGDEVEELAESFNAMSASLARSFSQQRLANQIGQRITSSLELSSVLQEIAAGAAQLLGGTSAAIVIWHEPTKSHRPLSLFKLPSELLGTDLPEEHGLAALARRSGNSVLVNEDDWGFSSGLELFDFKAALSVPLWSGSGVIGALIVLTARPERRYAEADLEVLTSFANQAAIAIDNAHRLGELDTAKAELAQSASELRNLLTQTLHAQEEERGRIAIELHDTVTPLVVGGLYEVQAARHLVHNDPEAADEKVRLVQQLLDKAIKEMRGVMLALRPVELEHGGLVPAVRCYADTFQSSTGLHCRVQVSGRAHRLTHAVEVSVYRIVQEALNNVRQHAAAHSVDVVLSYSRRASFSMLIRDDGRGFDLKHLARVGEDHLGLVGMKERARSVGGTVRVHSKIGVGTTVVFRLEHNEADGNRGAPD
jgi:signal transduction histidine kinase